MKRKANTELYFPHSSKSGTRINSRIFILETTIIWRMELSRDHLPLTTHNAMIISEMPMIIVNGCAYVSPRILPTMSSWRGTCPSTLQYSPLLSQTPAMIYVNKVYNFRLFMLYVVRVTLLTTCQNMITPANIHT
jgi:hypothetical protein